MIPSFIVERLGFERQAYNGLPPAVQLRLTLESCLVLVSCVLFGISGGYVAYIETYARSYAWLIAVVIGIGVFLFALNIQRLFITAGGFGLSRRLREDEVVTATGETYRTDAITAWRPDQLRLFFTFLLAVVFSQPLLLLVFSGSLGNGIKGVIEAQVAAFTQDQTSLIDQERARLVVRQRATLEKLAHAGFDIGTLGADPIPPAPAKPSLDDEAAAVSGAAPVTPPATAGDPAGSVASRPHKAMVIGVEKYLFEQPLLNPTKDANDMTRALRELGYQVTTVTGDKTVSASLLVEIDRYIKSLQPGDVSVFYFSGHGFMHQGTNYLAPADVGGPNAISINLLELIENIGRRSPRASILLLDACSSWPQGADRNGLGQLNGDIKGTLVAYAASPGQTALDLSRGQNGLFTQKLLKNLRNPQSVSEIMVKVRQEVVAEAGKRNHQQTPYVWDVLLDVVSFRSAQAAAPTTTAQSTPTSVPAASTRPSTRSPASTVDDADTAEPASDPCAKEQGHDVACLLADFELTANRIVRRDAAMSERLPVLISDYRQLLVDSGHLADRFRLQWLNPWKSAALSLLFVLLLWAGDLVRDLKPFALRAYERERYQQTRRLIRNRHEIFNRLTRAELEKFETYQRDTRERLPLWDTEHGFFFEEPIRRPDHRDLDIDVDSVLDLIEDLRGVPAA